ncbi:PD-(D/E)XK nuclease family protein [Microbacterium sp. nov. GSS16]|uniref:PD-(D/E)XK nuclease family protein n=1 Tax=Microbacterium sp. nov. GSS16 TaxID=3019890 RepID=UPI002305A4EA|nr:PD-(D/E)XK nuclease family protein [Microbacterium sp. nov. GSS16]WCD93282.1 PD-(D/E)XK nuclease family protein [Microbacterium sp. nov. GSS16]
MTHLGQWLSATSAGQLLRCPASAAYASTAKPIPPSQPQNAGTLAHLAMSAWLESGAWVDDEHGQGLQHAWDREAGRWKVDAKRLPDSVMTRARLRSRGPELAAVLKNAGATAHSEVFLQDRVSMLYGQLDVVVDNPRGGAVVDLKTGKDANSQGIRTQLLIYAALFKRESGHLPNSLIAFSLQHGPVQIEFSQREVDDVLAHVEVARTQRGLAVPDSKGCKYCRRRLTCEPHWNAARAWVDADCIEGSISKVEAAAGGLTAVRLSTTSGEQWVTGLTRLRPQDLITGPKLRVTEVAGRRSGAGREWRASRSTRASVLPDEG